MEFYTELLGFEETWTAGWKAPLKLADEITGLDNSAAEVRLLWTGHSYLELFAYSSPDPGDGVGARQPNYRGITHICFDVDDVDSEYERLVAAGVRFNNPPVEVLGMKTCYGRDPEDNIIEFQQIIDQPTAELPS
jgi:catechol 2,3-dioxygenase-like lactoylglutathione lyase family enzyme